MSNVHTCSFLLIDVWNRCDRNHKLHWGSGKIWFLELSFKVALKKIEFFDFYFDFDAGEGLREWDLHAQIVHQDISNKFDHTGLGYIMVKTTGTNNEVNSVGLIK